MKFFSRILIPMCMLLLAAASSPAQAYKLHQVEISGGAIGQYTTQLTHETGGIQTTTDSFGGMFSLREHPVAWAGLEFNYSFTEFTEKIALPNVYTNVKTDAHEATGAYLFHPHFRKLQPFLALGGGYIDFVPIQGQNQWRGTGLAELGFDIPTSNRHMGFRVQGRALVYRHPNFNTTVYGNENWAVTTQPAFGVWYRW